MIINRLVAVYTAAATCSSEMFGDALYYLSDNSYIFMQFLLAIIIINQVLRIIQIAVKSDVKTGRI